MKQQRRAIANDTKPTVADTRNSYVRRAFWATKIILAGYLAVGVVLLLIDLGTPVTGHGGMINSFMWGRSCGVAASGAVFLWFADAASRGQRWAYLRLRIISIAVPIIVAGLMVIPGAAPLWFKIAQLASAACIAAIAVVINNRRVRRVFTRNATESIMTG